MAPLPYIMLYCVLAFVLAQLVQSRELEPCIQWIDCRDQVPVTLDTTNINMDRLPDTLHCGNLAVSMDYGRPIGEHNNITLGLAMYRPKGPRGVIFL